MTFEEYLATNTGHNISYAVRITGLPYLWTDGKAEWIGGEFQVKIGGLATRAFDFTQVCDPMKPLNTGNGISVQLIDDGSDYLYELFAPDYHGVSTRLTASIDADAASLTYNVISSTGIIAGDTVYCGIEAALVDSVTATTLVLDSRGRFNSLRNAHKVADTDQGVVGPKVSTSPVIFRNRVLEVLAAPIDTVSGYVDDESTWIIWAGPIEEVVTETHHVEIKCESLHKLLESNWPHNMPACTLQVPSLTVSMTEQDWYLNIKSLVNTGSYITSPTQILGSYDTSGVFTAVTPANGFYTIPYIYKLINDTIKNYLWATQADRNKFYMTIEETPTRTKIKYTWGATSDSLTAFSISGAISAPLNFGDGDIYDVVFTCEKGAHMARIINYSNQGAIIAKSATEIDVWMDNQFNPFFTHPGLTVTDRGFAKITDGTNFEIISFAGVTEVVADSRHFRLTDVVRGLAGTANRKWVAGSLVGEDEDSTGKNVRIVQIAALTRHPESHLRVGVEEWLLAILSSTDDPAHTQQVYDSLGPGMGLSLNERFIDYDAIRSVLRQTDLPYATFFWVEEGKGKEDLENILKFSGSYLVTKRFLRDEEYLYGLSVETIEPAFSTNRVQTISDTHRKQGSRAPISHNERLIVNHVTMRPFLTPHEEGELVTITAQDSITDYGTSETLELKPKALYQFTDLETIQSPDYDLSDILAIHIDIVGKAALRWFAAFARGSYVLRLETTPKGLGIQVGDRVVISLTAVRAPDGSKSITNIPAKCIRAVHRHEGQRGASLEFRANFYNSTELVPCAEVAGVASTAITLGANVFSESFDREPFGSSPAVDADWFDPTTHTDTLDVLFWAEGDTTNFITRTISARSGNVVTINSAFSAGLNTAFVGGARILMTFGVWSSSLSALQKSYAYIADNSAPPVIDTDEAKEYS